MIQTLPQEANILRKQDRAVTAFIVNVKMTRKQKYSAEQILIITTSVLVVLLFLFPPWEIKRGTDPYYPVGVHFILEPPVNNPHPRHFSRIDYKRLRLHYFVLFSTSGLAWLFLRSRKPKADEKSFKFD